MMKQITIWALHIFLSIGLSMLKLGFLFRFFFNKNIIYTKEEEWALTRMRFEFGFDKN